jgi:cysteine-rich repeat protein
MNRTAFTSARLVVLILLVALGNPAPAAAAIDMSGVYEAIEFPCRYTFVQTGNDLQVTGPCSFANKPLSATGTIDPETGQFTVTGEVTGRCAYLSLTGTADGEMFTGTYICDTDSGPVTATKCLNGVIDPGEECQDGNAVDGDCCSSRCLLEPHGSTCATDANTCTDDVWVTGRQLYARGQ